MTSVYRLGGRVARSLGGGDGSAGGPPSLVIGLSLQRAGAGLIAAACVQVTVCVIVTRSGYPPVFVAVIFPVFLVLTAAGVALLRLGKDPAIWSAALCLLFAAFSATATCEVRDHYTGGLNVAEPLIGLGVFGAGMSASPLARRAAARA